MRRRLLAIPILVLGCAAALALPAPGTKEFEKTMPLPKTETKVGWSNERCAVVSVNLQNYPSSEDIEKARKDPSDHTWMWWNFHVENGGGKKCRIKLWVEVYDKNGKIAKASDRTDTVDAGKYDDNIRLSTRMRTLDIVESPKARVRAEIGPKD